MVSGEAAYLHYRLLFDPTYTGFCDVSTTVSCTQVYLSRFGTAFGVPVSVFGAIWFIAALLLVGLAQFGRAGVRDNASGYLFALSTIGLAVALYLGYASFFVLKILCPLCLLTYVAIIGLFLISGAATTFPMTTLPRRVVQDVRAWIASPLAIALTLLFFAGAASAVAFFPREGARADAASAPASQDRRSEFERYFASLPRVPLVIPAEGAKVLIVDFSDFQCPFCRQAYYALKPILAKYNAQQPGTVRLVLKDFPLNSKCNLNVSNGGPHSAACEAAVAVRLARDHHREEEMEEWLFSNQPAMTPAFVRQGARDIGQVTDYDEKYASSIELVKGDIALGHSLGVSSTPTLFINGAKIAGVLAPQYFDQAIAYELQHAPAKP